METNEKSTTDEIRESLEAQRASARQQFRRALAILDHDTRESLARKPEDVTVVCKTAAKRYVQLLAEFHGLD